MEDLIDEKKKTKFRGFRLWTFLVIIDGPFGVVSNGELIGILLWAVYIIRSVTYYFIQNLDLVSGFHMPSTKKTDAGVFGFSVWHNRVIFLGIFVSTSGKRFHSSSLAFLNYPAQLMFNSTEVMPVMVMRIFIPGLRRKYLFYEYVSTIPLVVGLILFTLADAETSPNFLCDWCCDGLSALIMDSFLGRLQEVIFTIILDTTQMENLFCSTVVGLPFLISLVLIAGEFFRAWNSRYEHPSVYDVLVFEALATFFG